MGAEKVLPIENNNGKTKIERLFYFLFFETHQPHNFKGKSN